MLCTLLNHRIVWILLQTLGRLLNRFLSLRLLIRIKRLVIRCRNFIVCQMEIHLFFSLFDAIIHIRQNHIGLHTLQLCCPAIDAIKLLNRHLQLTVTPWENLRHATFQRDKRLYCSFSESALTSHNHSPAIVLQCSRQNFRCRSTIRIRQNHDRTLIIHIVVLIRIHLNASHILHLNNWTARNKQSAHFNGIRQTSTPVIS